MTTDLKIIRDQNIFNLGDNIIRMNFILNWILWLTDRQADRQADRQTDIQIERQTDFSA